MPEKKETMSRVSKKQNDKKRRSQPVKKKKAPTRPLWKTIVFGILIAFIAALIAGAGLFAYYAASAPELTEKDLTGSISSDLLDDKGEVFYTLGGQNRDVVTEDQVPQVLKDAIISIEDQRFYTHKGIDPIRIGGAVVANLTKGFASEGGSTLTQQLIKLSVFSTDEADQTLKRKAQEAWLALKLEKTYTKEQILTFYINKVYMSDNNYGMSTASEYYYDKPLNELSLSQAAMLAGLPQSPNTYNPYTNPEKAEKRRNLVLTMMVDNKKLSTAEADEAKAVPIEDGLIDHSGDETNNLVFDSYLKEVIKEVKEKTKLDPYTAGLKIKTNLNMDAQQQVYDILNSDEYIAYPDEDIQAGVSMVDVKTGQLKAIGGGRNQEGQLSLNRASEMNRSVGSAIKPLSVYGPAIDYLNYSTYQQVVDEPYTFKAGGQLYNYDRSYRGQMSLREALIDSRNVPAAKILQEVGYPDTTEFLANLGIDVTKWNGETKGLVESNAIGGEITPIQLSAAYAAFSNGGDYTDPYTVSSVVLQNGQEIDLTPDTSKAMKDSTAYMITDILKDTVNSGTNKDLVTISGLPQAGKTGTTNYTDEEKAKYDIPSGGVPDSWFSGYTTNYSISVWVGYDDKYTDGHWLSPSSQQLPRKIYRSLMSHVSASVENSDWTKPASVVEVAVEAGSNPAKLPGPNTPSGSIVKELFVKGTQPTSVSTSFGEELKAPSGLKAAYDEEKDEISVQWDAYSLKDKTSKANYVLTVDGQAYETSDLSYVIQNPSEGKVDITLAVKANDKTGPKASTSVTVPEKEETEDSSADSSSESSEESSSQSSEESSSESENESSESSSSSSESSSEESSESAPEESSSSSQPTNEEAPDTDEPEKTPET